MFEGNNVARHRGICSYLHGPVKAAHGSDHEPRKQEEAPSNEDFFGGFSVSNASAFFNADAKRQAEILTESVWGKTATVTFAHAVADYLEHGAGNKRFLAPLLKHFGTTLLREIDQHAIDLAAKKLYPKAGPGTRNRQVFTPASAVLRHAARKGWCATPTLARPKQPKGIVEVVEAR